MYDFGVLLRQGVVDLRDSSLNIVEEGFTSGFGPLAV